MSMRLVIICLAATLAMSTLPVAPAAAQPAGQAGASPRQLLLARQYLDLLMTDQFESVVLQMLGADFRNDSAMQALPDEDRRFIASLSAELITDMVPQMITEMVPVYAATFTEEELHALVAFYSAPLGRSIARKSVEAMPETNRAMMAVMPQVLEKMATRMCQHYGCTPAEEALMREGIREGAGLGPGEASRSK